ncbi:MAG: hypothetical protein LWW81_04395, partial [Rhodocyclales bacterium]|nr:hypothetical protein [Rhodocyclales bacterium]
KPLHHGLPHHPPDFRRGLSLRRRIQRLKSIFAPLLRLTVKVGKKAVIEINMRKQRKMKTPTRLDPLYIYCHLIYALHATAWFSLLHAILTLIHSLHQHQADTANTIGMFIAPALLVTCQLMQYILKFTLSRASIQTPEWIHTHLKFQSKTFWIIFSLCLPLFVLMGIMHILIIIVLGYRTLDGWTSLYQKTPI